ncbi:hypothetical protein [Psychrobacter sp. 16-MNA-CIBAN-0192]|uniref:hypothetical protein n=1 Tax=Psychrobacter sp. 16-MNA-CIBAN-0192 TaxID=3140448 RepID=UPI0033194EE8
MFNPTFLASKDTIGSLLTRLPLSTLAVSLLLIAVSPAQAANSPATACASNLTYSIDQKISLFAKGEQQQLIDCMLTQLQPYQQKERLARQQYLAYKAQAWLNYANHEHSINSETAAGRHAFQEGSSILAALKNGTDEQINLAPSIPSTSALMRPDLWAVLNALKDSGGIAQAPRELAFSEVALIWAAAEQCAHGWRQSGTHFRMSERWLEQAREAYVNAHDSKTNVALEERINSYFKQYSPLDTGEDKCQGQVLPASMPSSSESISHEATLLKKERNLKSNTKLNTQPITTVMRTDALQIEITRTLSAVQVTPNIIPVIVMPAPIPMPIPTATYRITQ